MTTTQKIGVFIGSVAFLTGGYGAFSSCSNSRQMKAKKEPEAEINSRLPVGSKSNDVPAYLDQKHIEHSPYQSMQRTIFAIQRKTSDDLLIAGDIQIIFSFDRLAKVAYVGFKNIYTGP